MINTNPQSEAEDIKAGDEVIVTDSFGSYKDSGIVVKATESFIALDTSGIFSYERRWYQKDRAEKITGSCIVL